MATRTEHSIQIPITIDRISKGIINIDHLLIEILAIVIIGSSREIKGVIIHQRRIGNNIKSYLTSIISKKKRNNRIATVVCKRRGNILERMENVKAQKKFARQYMCLRCTALSM